ncbi:type II toxin-antitoxin system VapB family antitoxin [Spirulina major]|uniref:type II toxin-antitoxin system VapB family antitoxin n=1 Tax=Spirulina major TaxID=270636 RepID=UPI0009355529|nr:DUF2281 domain-containing protein [Spirulina major]
MEQIILQRLQQLPESAQQEALQFIDQLLAKYQQPKQIMRRTEALGIWQGKLWMADDFDAPLEELAEYM